VITIRGGIDIQRPLSRIVFPVDSTLETRQKATIVGFMAKCHDAEVHILKVYRSKVKDLRQNVDLYASQVARHFEKEGVRHVIDSVDADNLANAAIDYAKMIDANLIAIMTQQESGTSNLWMGPFAHQTVNHSPIPVLSVHPMETLAAGLGF
jgi:nucleotide-binding universal stress UspA family protein